MRSLPWEEQSAWMDAGTRKKSYTYRKEETVSSLGATPFSVIMVSAAVYFCRSGSITTLTWFLLARMFFFRNEASDSGVRASTFFT